MSESGHPEGISSSAADMPGTVGDPEPDLCSSMPVTWRELACVLLLVVLADVTIYRGEGFAADALLFVAAPLLLWIGRGCQMLRWPTILVAVLLGLVGVKLLWCGSWLLLLCGWALLFGFSMTLAGLCPYVLETIVYAAQLIRSGYEGLGAYGRVLERRTDQQQRTPWLNIGLPLLAVFGFGTIFVLANPDLVTLVSNRLESLVRSLRYWLQGFSFLEVLFWIAALWLSVGLIRPHIGYSQQAARDEESRGLPPVDAVPLYEAFRNTLLAVIGLFGVYLIFEFYTLWFQTFPREFFYSGRVHKYAHEGAAWLTLALALATVVLSLIFRGRTLGDPRLPGLKKLAWLWSLENGLLAITVYNRLFIYIGFNGMTRMRLIGLLGISCVVVGFGLVLWKIAFHKRFVWLLRRHLWTVAAAVYLYAVIPVDAIVHRYNVSRILGGEPAPAVQISVHPITAEGYLVLPPLLESEDEIIREGMQAMLAEEALALEREQQGWSTYQAADRRLLRQLRGLTPQLATYIEPSRDSDRRSAAIERFHEYAYQWY